MRVRLKEPVLGRKDEEVSSNIIPNKLSQVVCGGPVVAVSSRCMAWQNNRNAAEKNMHVSREFSESSSTCDSRSQPYDIY